MEIYGGNNLLFLDLSGDYRDEFKMILYNFDLSLLILTTSIKVLIKLTINV